VKPIAGSLKIPTVVPASSNAIITPPQDAKYMFKEFPASSDSLTAQLTYARDKGLHRVAILAANNAYGQEPVKALPDVIKNFNGLQLVASETFPPDATDVTAQLSAVARAKPDITLVWAVNPASAVVARSAANSNLPGLLFHSPGAATPLYIQVAGKAAEGTLVQGSKIGVPDAIKQGDPQYKIVHDFAQSWRTEFKTEPNQFAANGWDALLLVAQALKAGNVSPCDLQDSRAQLRDSLENNITNFAGINAVYSYSATQHGPVGIAGLAVLGVKNGAFTLEQSY
jgi:branched-chain amino acid transport system substrate-binding protein